MNKNLSTQTRSLNRFLEDFWNLPTSSRADVEFFTPTVEVEETENQFMIHFEVPGLKQDELDIEVNQNVLTVSGERKREETKKEKTYHYSERAYGKFKRSFTLPNNIEFGQIEAQHADGILTLVLPKKAETQAKKIAIGKPASQPSQH